MLEVQRVDKRFGRRKVLDGVSFSVARGEILGFVGPNGAGKTTTLRIITGFLDADRGRVLVDGHDIDRERSRAVARIGYLPENAPLYRDMRVVELLAYRARLKGLRRSQLRPRIDEVVSACGGMLVSTWGERESTCGGAWVSTCGRWVSPWGISVTSP